MRNTKKVVTILVLIILLVFLANIEVYADETNFTFEEESFNIGLNGVKNIIYSGGTGDITWESSDDTVATVNNGEVKALRIGKTTITATRGRRNRNL